MRKCQGPRIIRMTLKKNSKIEGFVLLDFTIYYKAKGIMYTDIKINM